MKTVLSLMIVIALTCGIAFVSVRASDKGGELVTKPLRFSGNRLTINYFDSAAGGLRVEMLSAEGQPISGLTLDECPEIIGDQIEHTVSWNSGPDIGRLAGQPIRLRFVMRDADLYSIKFA